MSAVIEAIALAEFLLQLGERIYRTFVTGSASPDELKAIRRVLGVELAATLAKRTKDAQAKATLGG